MGKQRYILFGYRLLDGELTFNEQEAEAVQMIFSQYLQGLSYKDIAELMIAKGVSYRENTLSWNKSMIKRILENPKYLGRDEYPRLISDTEYNRVLEIKTSKYSRKDISLSPVIRAIQNKIQCYECSGRLTRHIIGKKGYKKERWYCKNDDCSTDSRITDTMLLEGIIAILNRVITAPAILDMEDITSYTHTLEITKLTNEINRELEKKELNEDYIKDLIMACAAKKFDCCTEGNLYHLTQKLKGKFQNISFLTEFDIELFEETVENIKIEKDGTVHVRFINQKSIMY